MAAQAQGREAPAEEAAEAAAAGAPSAPPAIVLDSPMEGGTLVVWDYDWSLINTNSDTFVIEQLRPELMSRFSTAGGMGWTALMDCQMQGLFERGVSREDLAACMAAVPCFEGNISAMELCRDQAAEQIILSDANTFFIESFLEKRGLSPMVRAVYTNASHFDEQGRLHVRPYHEAAGDAPHACPLCPPNLCKGIVLERIRAELRPARVIYVGDGGGDHCPCCDLTAGDAVLCRAPPSPPLDHFGLFERLRGTRQRFTRHAGGARPAQVVAEVHMWRNGEELLSAFSQLLGQRPAPEPAGAAA